LVTRGSVDASGRFIENQELWIGSQGSGDEHALFLSAGEFVDRSSGEGAHTDKLQTVLDHLFVHMTEGPTETGFTVTPHLHHLADGDRKLREVVVVLWRIADGWTWCWMLVPRLAKD
jgi:hypothetical protein